jgi:transcriptional regulator of acetoin/glycerol metabolism
MTSNGPTIRTLEETERRAVVKALRASDSMTEAAKRLGVNRRTLYRMCKRWNIEQQRRCPRCKRRMPT